MTKFIVFKRPFMSSTNTYCRLQISLAFCKLKQTVLQTVKIWNSYCGDNSPILLSYSSINTSNFSSFPKYIKNFKSSIKGGGEEFIKYNSFQFFSFDLPKKKLHLYMFALVKLWDFFISRFSTSVQENNLHGNFLLIISCNLL